MKPITNVRFFAAGASVALLLASACDVIDEWPDQGPTRDADEGEDEGEGGDDHEGCDEGEDEGGDDQVCIPDDPCALAKGPGHLEGFKCDLDYQWADELGISCEEALLACEVHALDYPGHSYLCEWNGQQIFASEVVEGACDPQGPALEPCDDEPPPPPPPPACEEDPCAGREGEQAAYYFDYCSEEGGNGFTPFITCQDALDNCLLNDVSNPGLGIYCEWDGITIHRNDLGVDACVPMHGVAPDCDAPDPGTCELEDPCAGAGGLLGFGVAWLDCANYAGESLMGPGESPITCVEAQLMCLDLAAANPGQSLYCQWNDRSLFLDEAAPGDCSAFDPC